MKGNKGSSTSTVVASNIDSNYQDSNGNLSTSIPISNRTKIYKKLVIVGVIFLSFCSLIYYFIITNYYNNNILKITSTKSQGIPILGRQESLQETLDPEFTATDFYDSMDSNSKCQSDSDCYTGDSVKRTCFKCPNGKMVECKSYPRTIHKIIQTSSPNQGLCRSSIGGKLDSLYTNSCSVSSSFYCLIDVEGIPISTVDIKETLDYFPIWKNKLIKQSGIDEQYFNNHFKRFVTYVSKSQNDASLLIKYVYKIDKVAIYAFDEILYKKNNIIIDINEIAQNFFVRFNHPLNNIVPEQEIKSTLENKCFDGADAEYIRYELTSEGRAIMKASATKDFSENECISGSVDIENGKIVHCVPRFCVIVD